MSNAKPFWSKDGPVKAEIVTLRISVALADKIRDHCERKLYTWDTFVENSISKALFDERVITSREAALARIVATSEKEKE